MSIFNSNGVVFCHNDADGYCCAAIARRKYPDVWIVPTSYGTRLQRDKLRPGEQVFLLDISFPLEDMLYLHQHHPIIMINRKTAGISEMEAAGVKYRGMVGGNDASCCMAWKYFFPDEDIPLPVKWIGDFDTWKLAYEESIPFNFGLTTFRQFHNKDTEKMWRQILDYDCELVYGLLDRGRSICLYTDTLYKAYAQDLIFPTEFEGLKFLAMNVRGVVSLAFKHYANQSDMAGCLAFRWDNHLGAYRVSLFSLPNESSTNINMAELAIRYGGNGSPGAAGFSCNDLPFKLGGIEGRQPTYDDPYESIRKCLQEHPAATAYSLSTCRGTAFSSSFDTTFENQPCVGVNTWETDAVAFGPLNTINSKLGITFVWTNCGSYRVIVRPLCVNSDIQIIKDKYKGEFVNGAVWIYTKDLPFTLRKHIQ